MADRITLDRDFPVVEGEWDSGAAKARIFEAHTNAEGEFDAAGAADFFLIGDPDTGLKGDLHLPVADIRDGDRVIVGNALRAARSRLGQGFPAGIAADIKDRANEVAGRLLDDLRDRQDAHPWMVGIMVPLPAMIAAQFPQDRQPAHLTLVHVEFADDEQANCIAKIAQEEAEALFGETLTLGPLGTFDSLERRVIFSTVDMSDAFRRARDRIANRIADLEIEVSRLCEDWVPHVTVTVTEPGNDYAGTVPAGTWDVDEVQVWRGGQIHTVAKAERADALPLVTPAVHTLPKTAVEEPRADKAYRVTPLVGTDLNGYRTYEVLYSRADNIQPIGNRLEFRPAEVVFEAESMAGGVGVPWELRHSADLLTPSTVRGQARGTVLTVEAHADGLHTSGLARAWDAGLMEAIATPRSEGGAPDVSVAYRVLTDKRPGTHAGKRYDQRVLKVVWNSLASEPHGKAGTARVLAPRADAQEFVSRADALLAIANSQRAPSTPVYYDLTNWVRNSKEPRKDQIPMNPMKLLMMAILEAQGKSLADIAGAMGISEDDAGKILSGETEMTPDMMAMIAKLLAGEPAQDAEPPPAPAANEGMQAEIDAMKSKLEAMEAELQSARSDAAEKIPRADAEKMVEDRADAIGRELGHVFGRAIWLAKRARGSEFTPEARTDSDGAELAVDPLDYQLAAIAESFRMGATTDEERARADGLAAQALKEIDEAPDAARAYVVGIKLNEAQARMDAAESKVDSIKAAVARAAANGAEADRRDGEQQNRLRTANEQAKKVAATGQKGDA